MNAQDFEIRKFQWIQTGWLVPEKLEEVKNFGVPNRNEWTW